MKRKLHEEIIVPEGINCKFADGRIEISKGGSLIVKKINTPGIDIKLGEGKIIIECKRAHRKENAIIKTLSAHMLNSFKGLESPFVYELEVCNVHFPMSVKVEGKKIVITNFLGEKEKRTAEILDGVKVDVKGNKIEVSGSIREDAGQTAANIEKATKISKRDRRVFQDGVFIVRKPGDDER